MQAAAAGVRTFPPRHVSPGHGFRERVYGSDTRPWRQPSVLLQSAEVQRVQRK